MKESDTVKYFHLHQQTMKFLYTSLVGQIPPLWNQEKYCLAV